jgi:hypothetical protein
LAGRFAADPSRLEKLAELKSALKIVTQMPFPVNVWVAQNHVYAVKAGLYQRTRRKAQRGDTSAQAWLDNYLELCDLLSIRIE